MFWCPPCCQLQLLQPCSCRTSSQNASVYEYGQPVAALTASVAAAQQQGTDNVSAAIKYAKRSRADDQHGSRGAHCVAGGAVACDVAELPALEALATATDAAATATIWLVGWGQGRRLLLAAPGVN